MSAADRYTHGHHASVVGQHARRTAERDAAYLLPRLRPGMGLLDVGCGPGTITAGLAERVAPGETVGIDVSAEVVEQARASAEGRGVRPRFEVASVYELPWPEATFDVVHAHQVLQHLARPVEALREMHRVLRPGGLVAVRDADYATMIAWPRQEQIERWNEVYHAVAHRNGGEPDAGRRLGAWLREAGFEDIETSATTVLFTDRAAVENWALSWAERTTSSNMASGAVEYGIATRQELEAIAAGWRTFAAEPDAFFMYVNVECIGKR